MEIQVRFTYLSKIIQVTCKDDEGKSEMFQKFTDQLNDDSKPTHYIYYYEGNKLDYEGKICEDRYLRGEKDIIISVQKKLRFIKCPECVCNDCIVNLDNNLLTFYGCKNNHTTTKKYDEYIKVQKIEGPELKCNTMGCTKNQQNYFKGFYKCFECSIVIPGGLKKSTKGGSQYYCKKHLEEEHKKHFNAKYDKKNYYCEKHKKTFMEQGFDEKEAASRARKKANEDARFVLPNACETKIVVTMNVRSLFNFFRHRCCSRAQWEIKAVADEMLKLCLINNFLPSSSSNAFNVFERVGCDT